MSELAFNQSGDPFALPEHVSGWRVKRMKPRGAPELVYGTDGHPLVIDRAADMDDLRAAVGQAGRYRLDAVNDEGQIATGVPIAYVHVVQLDEKAGAPVGATPIISAQDGALVEAMRLNTSLARTVIDQFPAMMMGTAEILRAADGAGLPARQSRIIDIADPSDEDDDTDDAATAGTGSPIFEMLNQIAAQIVPVIVMQLAPKLGGLLDRGKALAAPPPNTIDSSAPSAPAKPATAKPTASVVPSLAALSPSTLAKLAPIYAQLAPAEVARASKFIAELTPADVTAFAEQLAELPAADALAKVRALIGSESVL
ncbi:MAG TPA: hypothetical protein VGL61_35895 [Kofleriaceae bacterium]